jgi:hypothetical protein
LKRPAEISPFPAPFNPAQFTPATFNPGPVQPSPVQLVRFT